MSTEIILAGIELQNLLIAESKIPKLANFERGAIGFVINLRERKAPDLVRFDGQKDANGKRKPLPLVMMPKIERSSEVRPNCLVDNVTYLLGISKSSDIKHVNGARARHEAFVARVSAIRQAMERDGVDARLLRRIEAFYANDGVEALKQRATYSGLEEGYVNLGSFTFDDALDEIVTEDPDIAPFLDDSLYEEEARVPRVIQCCVTGQFGPQGRLHGVLKVPYGPTTGGKLCSNNAASFRSWDQDRDDTSPMIETTTRGYHRGLNFIMNNAEHAYRTEEVTIVAWTPDGKSSPIVPAILGTADDAVKQWLANIRSLSAFQPVAPELPDQNVPLYVLGISPGYRVIPRFFGRTIAGEMYARANRWFDGMATAAPRLLDKMSPLISNSQFADALQGRMPNRRTLIGDDSLREVIKTDLLEAALTEKPIPAHYLDDAAHAFMLTSLAVETLPTGGKVPGFYLREVFRHRCIALMTLYFNWKGEKGRLPMALDQNNHEVPYLLGRLFAIFEAAQRSSVRNFKLNMTGLLKTYVQTPQVVMPGLLLKNTHHMNDPRGFTIWLQPHLAEVSGQLIKIPERLTREEQCILLAGYRHQEVFFRETRPKKEVEAEQGAPETDDSGAAEI